MAKRPARAKGGISGEYDCTPSCYNATRDALKAVLVFLQAGGIGSGCLRVGVLELRLRVSVSDIASALRLRRHSQPAFRAQQRQDDRTARAISAARL